MIDRKHQNKKNGKIAMKLLLNEIGALNQFTYIELTYDLKNKAAEAVYLENGFENHGYTKDDGSIILIFDS